MAASTVCNLQRILSSGAVLNLLHAVHVANPWDLAKVLLEARKMAQIDSLDPVYALAVLGPFTQTELMMAASPSGLTLVNAGAPASKVTIARLTSDGGFR